MKPAPFRYERAKTLDDVHALLAEHGEEARLLAGGQSLMPLLNMRLAEPRVLVDINHVAELSGIEIETGTLRVGALTRHVELERSPEIARGLPLIHRAVPHIGHPAIRNMGTLGGSIAMADPAAELPACAVALNARIVLEGPSGRRTVASDDFFQGLLETEMTREEVLVAVEFPLTGEGYRSAIAELCRRHGDYAMVGLAAHGRREGSVISELRLVFFGVGDRPVVARAAAAAAEGQMVSPSVVGAVQAALGDDLDPPGDLQAGPEMKAHLARVLAARVLNELAAG